MKVLIIGGTRFIGAHVARRLYEQGTEITTLHRGRSHNLILPPVNHVIDPDAEYPIIKFPAAVTEAQWDAVVHMVMMGEADAQAAVTAFAGRAGRLVTISSGDVYRAYGRLTGSEPGPPDATPLDEDAPKRTVFYPYRGQEGQYGAFARDYEKVLAEQTIARAMDLSWTVLRLPKVYGPEDNGDLGTVYGFADKPAWRWTHGHVENVAAAVVLATTHPNAAGRAFNVGEPYTPTMGERLARLPARQVNAPAPPFDYRQDMAQDTTRIRAELGFTEVIDEELAMATVAGRNS